MKLMRYNKAQLLRHVKQTPGDRRGFSYQTSQKVKGLTSHILNDIPPQYLLSLYSTFFIPGTPTTLKKAQKA